MSHPLPIAALVLLLVTPFQALANGGPVAWTGSGPAGGVRPIAHPRIQLVSEDLSLRVSWDGDHYSVEALYHLRNPGEKELVVLGVPLYVNQQTYAFVDDAPSNQGERYAAQKKIRASMQAAAEAVTIAIGRETFACELDDSPRAPGGLELLPEHSALDGAYAWCMAEVQIPPGDDVELRMSYRAQLYFSDDEFSKSALTVFSERTLIYPVFPAGYWAGDTERLTVRLDPGPYLDFVEGVYPTGARHEKGELVWDLRGVDLKAVGSFQATFKAQFYKRARQLARWNLRWLKDPPGGLEPVVRKVAARASSQLPPQGRNRYDPKLVADGRAETAWCEGVSGPGEGEWIELEIHARPSRFCRLEGLALVPGYGKNQSRYRTNGRVKRVTVHPCGQPDKAWTETVFPLADAQYRSAVLLRPGRGIWDKKETTCLRVIIEEVAPGTKYEDTCISEIAPIFNCG